MLVAHALQGRIDELPQLARRLDSRIASVDDAERHGAGVPTQPVDDTRRGLSAADVEPEACDRKTLEIRELLDDPVDREEVRIQRHRYAGLRHALDRLCLEIDELGMRGERRLLDVDERRADRLEAAELRGERIRRRERALLEALVVRVLGRERRERERPRD